MLTGAQVGGHYYTGSVSSDPWSSVAYTASASGTASGTLSVTTGATSAEVAGRAFIVHAYDGSRIACALLEAPPNSCMRGSSAAAVAERTGGDGSIIGYPA